MNATCHYCEGEIHLEGDAETLHSLAHAIREAKDDCEFSLEGTGGSFVFPASERLPVLRVQRSEGPVWITRQEGGMLITGSQPNLAILAQNIAFAATNPQSNHEHIEFYPGSYVDHRSIPVVVYRLGKPGNSGASSQAGDGSGRDG